METLKLNQNLLKPKDIGQNLKLVKQLPRSKRGGLEADVG